MNAILEIRITPDRRQQAERREQALRLRQLDRQATCSHAGSWSTGPDGGKSVCSNCGTIRDNNR
jgi:hypothetical protein